MRRYIRNISIFVILFAAFVGCRPRGVLSNREMRDVLYDLHRADGAIQVAGYNYGHSQELASYYKSVLDKHGVTQAEFDSSLVWFTDNPQIFNKIYPRVIDMLQVDMDREDALRDQRLDKMRTRKEVLPLGEEKAADDQGASLRPLEEVLKEYQNGIENPWKIWVAKEFCEKNAIIFGQLEKK